MLPIDEIFNSIQFEGTHYGTAATFIRLHGCPVRCPWCDEGYADGGTDKTFARMSVETIVEQVKQPFVVITGGEPLIHDVSLLFHTLAADGKRIAIETSGIHWCDAINETPNCWVTLSPKAHLSTRAALAPDAWFSADEIKLVVSKPEDVEFYLSDLKRHPRVFLQPEWTTHDRSLTECIKWVERFPQWRISLQCHKFCGIQ